MKYLRLSLATGVLTMCLATNVLAGDMPCTGIASPAPPSAAGEMPYPRVASANAVTEIAVGLIQSVLSLF